MQDQKIRYGNKQGLIIHPEELTETMIGMLTESKINVLGLHPVGGEKADETLEALLQLLNTTEFQDKLERIRSAGIAVEYELHALSWLLPRTLYEEHPQWFRMNESGERINDYNMCVSNEEALCYLEERTASLAASLRSDTGRYYFWSDDVKEGICHCEKCRELSASDQALIIYHAMLRGIRRTDPRAKQCFLAYHATVLPPQKVRPEEGIFLEYAPIHRDTKVPVKDQVGPEGQTYEQTVKALLNYFGSEDACALEYWMDNSLFSHWQKPPKYLELCTDTVREDLAFYRECGFRDITSFGCYLSDDYIALYGIPPIREFTECY